MAPERGIARIGHVEYGKKAADIEHFEHVRLQRAQHQVPAVLLEPLGQQQHHAQAGAGNVLYSCHIEHPFVLAFLHPFKQAGFQFSSIGAVDLAGSRDNQDLAVLFAGNAHVATTSVLFKIFLTRCIGRCAAHL